MVKPFKKAGKENYYFQVMIDGKRICESTGTQNHKEAVKIASARITELTGKAKYSELLKRLIDCINAEDVLNQDAVRKECIAALETGIFIKMKLSDVYTEFRKKYKKNISERAFADYSNLWGKFLLWIQQNYSNLEYMNQITVDVAESFLEFENSKGISGRTYNERIKKFRTIWSALAQEAGVENVWKLTQKKVENTISKENLTNEQLKALFLTADERLKYLFLIGIYTGLRLNDCCFLKWSEVDFRKNLIIKTPSKTKSHNKSISIPIHEILAQMLVHLQADNNNNEYVLPDIAEEYQRVRTSLTRRIQRTFEKAGITTKADRAGSDRKTAQYGFHSFRHSFISLCAEANIPMHTVMNLVGHSSEAIHRVYQHASNEQKIKAINILPDINFNEEV